MSEKRATLEIIAPTVEEAVEKGLDDLGLPEDAVEVEVLDQGSRGLFGIGSRHARVRLTIKGAGQAVAAAPSTRAEAARPAAPPPAPAPVVEEEDEEDEEEPVEEAVPARVAAVEKTPPAPTSKLKAMEDDYEVETAEETVKELIEKLKVRATVTARRGEADSERSRVPILVDVNGDDLSILIGRRAETLNALQYISTIIVSKELGKPVSLLIDVQGYRSRREGQLRQLARRMAEQAVKSGRRQVLEPMPANERRIVHIELRENSSVTTESVGEEPRRKVTIIPKE